MKCFFRVVQCVISKNWLDFGGDLTHVASSLELQLPWPRFALDWSTSRDQCRFPRAWKSHETV